MLLLPSLALVCSGFAVLYILFVLLRHVSLRGLESSMLVFRLGLPQHEPVEPRVLDATSTFASPLLYPPADDDADYFLDVLPSRLCLGDRVC